jgi:hypothetical protein
MDLNCDGSNLAVEPCILAQAACGETEGVQLCQEDPVKKFGSCEPSPACECVPGMCSTCTFLFVPDGQTAAKPCAPGISELPFLGAGACSSSEPCTVEVLRVDGPWRAAVAADGMASFGLRAVVTKNSVALRLKLDESSVMKDPSSIGSLHLAVSGSAPEPLYLRVDLRLEASGIPSCDSVKRPDGDYSMLCK